MRNRFLAVLIVAFLSIVGTAALSAQQYTMESVPKLVATWFDEFYKGVQKAGTDFGVTVSQQAPAAADPAQQVRLIEDAVNAGTTLSWSSPTTRSPSSRSWPAPRHRKSSQSPMSRPTRKTRTMTSRCSITRRSAESPWSSWSKEWAPRRANTSSLSAPSRCRAQHLGGCRCSPCAEEVPGP